MIQNGEAEMDQAGMVRVKPQLVDQSEMSQRSQQVDMGRSQQVDMEEQIENSNSFQIWLVWAKIWLVWDICL